MKRITKKIILLITITIFTSINYNVIAQVGIGTLTPDASSIGDGVNIVIEFKANPTTNKSTKITVAIDIGGGIGEIYTRDFITSKGVGVEHYYLSSLNA
ncbi:MAG: hypothetical protein KBT69_07435 [Oceanihabitans sp.]|nr:hypothetical protein [Oceanihabitans sp.]